MVNRKDFPYLFFFPLSACTSLFKTIFQPDLACEIGLQLLARPWWEMLPTAGEQQAADHTPSLGECATAESEGQMTAPKI